MCESQINLCVSGLRCINRIGVVCKYAVRAFLCVARARYVHVCVSNLSVLFPEAVSYSCIDRFY